MSAAVYNIRIEQGATFRFPKFQFGTLLVDPNGVPILDPDGNQQIDIPRDFTGCRFRLQMRTSRKTTADEVFTVTSEDADGGITVDIDAGAISVVVPDELTDAAEKGGFYDLKCYNPDSTEDRLVEGSVSVSPAVTTDALVVNP